MRRLLELLIHLYPPSFRRRFAEEWRETADWHRDRLQGARAGRIRLAGLLLRDSLAAIPHAYWSVVVERAVSFGSVGHDLRHAVRGLVRSRQFTAAAIASLATGIGANVAIFSVVNAVLLRPLPFPAADRLTIVWNEFASSGQTRLPLSPVQVAELADEPGLFESVGGVWATRATVHGSDDTPTQISAGRITPGFFSVLGVEPAMGRGFTTEGVERPRPLGVIISHELWQGTLGGDPDVLEKTLRVDGAAVNVVGVLPPGFRLFFPPDGSIPERLDMYSALPWDLRQLPAGLHYLRVVGRLEPGVSLPQARESVNAAAARARSLYPELAVTEDRLSIHPLQGDAVRAARPALLTLLAGVGLFLLLAAANVASLVLARASTRQREMAVRSCLGASRLRLGQLVILESLVIGAAATALGLWLGAVGAEALWALRPEGIVQIDTVSLDGTVLAFTLVAAVAATLAFGLAPLGVLGRGEPGRSLRAADGRSVGAGGRTRQWITVGEVAIGLVLLVGAALMGQTVSRLGQADLGFAPEGLLTFQVSISERRFPGDAERAALARDIERRISGLPGVTAAGATSHIPLGRWANWGDPAPPDGTPDDDRDIYFADHRSVTPGFFGAVGATLVEGRVFDDRDREDSSPVVIIDRAMARRAFPDGNALGRILHASRYVDGSFVPTPAVVVGVIEDIRDVSPARPSGGQVFWPFRQSARWELTWALRSDNHDELLSAVRREVQTVSPDLAVAAVTPMEELVHTATGDSRFVALLGGVFSLLALLLAGLGLYGVISFVAIQRTREYGLRMVLGAERGTILNDVLRDGLKLGSIGVLLGLIAAFGVTRFLESLLYGVSPTDLRTLTAVGMFFLAVALLASLGPALRATRADPMTTMRE